MALHLLERGSGRFTCVLCGKGENEWEHHDCWTEVPERHDAEVKDKPWLDCTQKPSMTPERAIELLRELRGESDPEQARVCAEDIIVDLLNYFDAEEVGRVWTQEVPAWKKPST